jgi:hypothetical protein
MRRRRRDANSSKNNSIDDLVGNEDNGYPIPGPNKTMINVTNEASYTYKKNHSKMKSWKN